MLHEKQRAFCDCDRKRIVVRAGRRGGKTTGIADRHVNKFLDGHRVLYGAPTEDQVQRYWFEVTVALAEPIAAGIYKKNESTHTIELPGTEQRIKAKTMWNPNTARGDYGDEVCLDEFQMMKETTWTQVIAPMMLDHDGTTTFIYTPPDAAHAVRSQATDPMFAAKLYEKARKDTTGRWACFHFTSHDNPHLSTVALEEITLDIDDRSYRQEIMAEDIWETPGALWTQDIVDNTRVRSDGAPIWYEMICVFIDPSKSGKPGADECGMSVEGLASDGRALTINDLSERCPPDRWGITAVGAVGDYREMCGHIEICAEDNIGGQMIMTTINPIAEAMGIPEARMTEENLIPSVSNKYIRAQPIRARWKKQCGIIGNQPRLEYQMCNWIDGAQWSPDRMEAMVGGKRRLLLKQKIVTEF